MRRATSLLVSSFAQLLYERPLTTPCCESKFERSRVRMCGGRRNGIVDTGETCKLCQWENTRWLRGIGENARTNNQLISFPRRRKVLMGGSRIMLSNVCGKKWIGPCRGVYSFCASINHSPFQLDNSGTMPSTHCSSPFSLVNVQAAVLALVSDGQWMAWSGDEGS